MTGGDPVTALVRRAAQRYNNAERSVMTLHAELAREVAAPDTDPRRSEEIRSLLAERIVERDAALQRLQKLQSTPRWVLEKELTEIL